MPLLREMESTLEKKKTVKLMSSKFSKNKLAQEAVMHPDDVRVRRKKKDGFEAEEVRKRKSMSISLCMNHHYSKKQKKKKNFLLKKKL